MFGVLDSLGQSSAGWVVGDPWGIQVTYKHGAHFLGDAFYDNINLMLEKINKNSVELIYVTLLFILRLLHW